MAGRKKEIANYVAATLFAGDDKEMRKKRDECVAFLYAEFAARWQMINKKEEKDGSASVLKKGSQDEKKVMKQANCTNIQRRELVRYAVSRCVDKYANDKDANGVATIMQTRRGSVVESTRTTAVEDEGFGFGDENEDGDGQEEVCNAYFLW